MIFKGGRWSVTLAVTSKGVRVLGVVPVEEVLVVVLVVRVVKLEVLGGLQVPVSSGAEDDGGGHNTARFRTLFLLAEIFNFSCPRSKLVSRIKNSLVSC